MLADRLQSIGGSEANQLTEDWHRVYQFLNDHAGDADHLSKHQSEWDWGKQEGNGESFEVSDSEDFR